jgi:hypothetical protein
LKTSIGFYSYKVLNENRRYSFKSKTGMFSITLG